MNPFKQVRRRRDARVEATYFVALVDALDGQTDPRFLDQAREDIRAGEAEIGFENLFSNLYEHHARLHHDQIERLIEASRALGLELRRYELLIELEAFPEDDLPVDLAVLPPVPPSVSDAARAAR